MNLDKVFSDLHKESDVQHLGLSGSSRKYPPSVEGGYVWDKVRKVLGTEILFNIANMLFIAVRSALSSRIYILGEFFLFFFSSKCWKKAHLLF